MTKSGMVLVELPREVAELLAKNCDAQISSGIDILEIHPMSSLAGHVKTAITNLRIIKTAVERALRC